MIIGTDIKGNKVSLGQKVKRDDGVIGNFDLRAFELVFEYDDAQENGAVCCYINKKYTYEIV